MSLWAPDAVFTLASGGFAILEGNVIRGRDALRRLWEDLTLAFDSFEFVTEALDDLGHSVVFGAFAMRGKPHGGGSAVEIRFGTVSIWRDRQIASATNYTDVAEARAAAERLAEERAYAELGGARLALDRPPRWRRKPAGYPPACLRSPRFPTSCGFGEKPQKLPIAVTGTRRWRSSHRRPFGRWNRWGSDWRARRPSRASSRTGSTLTRNTKPKRRRLTTSVTAWYSLHTQLNGRPLGSPSRVQERWAFTVTWAAGLIVRVSGNTDIAEARAAAERLAQERR